MYNAIQTMGEAKDLGLPTRWVFRLTIEDEQWAALLEYGGLDTWAFQLLSEDRAPAFQHRWGKHPEDGVSTKTEGVLPYTVFDKVTAVASLMEEMEEDGWGWSGDLYEWNTDLSIKAGELVFQLRDPKRGDRSNDIAPHPADLRKFRSFEIGD